MATIHDIAAAIGAAPEALSGLSGLDADRVEGLLHQIHSAVAAEDELVATSLEAALAAVPRPLRGRARALLLEEA